MPIQLTQRNECFLVKSRLRCTIFVSKYPENNNLLLYKMYNLQGDD